MFLKNCHAGTSDFVVEVHGSEWDAHSPVLLLPCLAAAHLLVDPRTPWLAASAWNVKTEYQVNGCEANSNLVKRHLTASVMGWRSAVRGAVQQV